jgi:phenylalanyl-tRNA synthetase alpha chain
LQLIVWSKYDYLYKYLYRLNEINSADSTDSLETIRLKLLGQNGEITSALKNLGKVDPALRKEKGAEINKIKSCIQEALIEKKNRLLQKY